MKAVSVEELPAGKWHLEIKLDGYRAVAVLNHGEVELWSRNHKPLTSDYPEVVAALREIPCVNAVLDGEIVALDEQGRSRFQLLQQRGMKGARCCRRRSRSGRWRSRCWSASGRRRFAFRRCSRWRRKSCSPP